jgi:hypothetical protein
MLEDGVKDQGCDEEVRVQDIAEILLEAVERADAAPVTAQFEPGV